MVALVMHFMVHERPWQETRDAKRAESYGARRELEDDEYPHQCLCRGRGPAGLMLGLLLAKRGVEVIVLEAHETFDREFRGEVLQPSTAHLLDELGLLEYILAQPHSTSPKG